MNIQKLVNDKYKSGLSTASIRKMFNIINQSLSHAVNGNMITKNPAEPVHLPKHTQKQIKVFTQEEQNRFLECSKGDALHELFILALDTGIRLGELLALTWDDVDFDNETIHVNKNLITVKDFYNTAESNNILIIQDTPKTKASIRKVPLTKRSLELLKKMNPDQSAIGSIFRTKTKNFISPRNAERSFCRIAAKAGISKCNFHTARHSYATRLFELGIPAKVVSELLGHSKVSHTLDIYTHVIPVIKNEAIRTLDAFYDRQSETSGVNQIVNQ
jgi:integrase